jgi:formylmethanofuran dehydrogenase subunit E
VSFKASKTYGELIQEDKDKGVNFYTNPFGYGTCTIDEYWLNRTDMYKNYVFVMKIIKPTPVPKKKVTPWNKCPKCGEYLNFIDKTINRILYREYHCKNTYCDYTKTKRKNRP